MVTHKASSDAEVLANECNIRERIVSVKDLVLRKLSMIVVDQTTAVFT